MNDLLVMGDLQGLADLDDDADGAFLAERLSAFDDLAQAPALDVLHDDVGLPLRRLAGIKDRGDAVVLEVTDDRGFLSESLIVELAFRPFA